jgi:hypothetical protein
MEQLIIRPLEEWYETISIRTTNLENYNDCPFRYRFEPPKSDDYKPFVFGRLVHSVCWAYLIGKTHWEKNEEDVASNEELKEQLLALVKAQNPDGLITKDATEKTPEKRVTRERFWTYIDILHQKYINDKFILAEFSMWLEIHLGKYKITITGTLDLLTSDFCIVDLKTSSKEWKEESIKKKLQKIIYLYIIYKIMWREDIWFDYAVMRSDLKLEKNVKLQVIRTKLDVEAFEYVLTNIAEAFIYSTEHNVWPTKQCDACRYCGLGPKWNGKCPLYDKKPIWTSEENT